MACTDVANGTGRTVCDLAHGAGEGVSALLGALKDNMIEIIVTLAIVGALVALVYAVSGGLGSAFRGAFNRSNK